MATGIGTAARTDRRITQLGITIVRSMIDWNEIDIELESVPTSLLKLPGVGYPSFVADTI